MRAFEWHVACCRVCGLLYVIWAFVWYLGSCIISGMLYACGLLDIRAAVYVGC